ncbi:dephospho-CoA kinase [Paenarthrobacter nicotinovorans]|uniref:dephospho-CoA kinase n=1 Tax=Micrococcaceae TaxID=1268 RepID=UPI0008770020|nr:MULTISPECIES: dephospho-CoA kinase [Micrococcaceae]MDR6436435.1 dephospho-CoA kinase [Paenarthrobacter nicotinovorans]SCZ57728.1 dephospho-CoA kinase [Arthrobacter sp. UNCCL28]
MLKIGLTGGIASGKSLVAARLQKLGALLIDADLIARQVVEPGTAGLDRITAAFGPGILDAEGRLDRPKLGSVVFRDPAQRELLNSIVHPLVREKAAAMMAGAGPTDIVVQDIPLLVETGQGSNFHLVVVVDAPEEVRLQRMVDFRAMTAEDAQARMAAQATTAERNAAADVVLANAGAREELLAQVDALWTGRLVPFAENLGQGQRAGRHTGPVLSPANPDWTRQAGVLTARIAAAAPARILAVDHVGSTSVPGLAAKDVIDLQVAVADLETADDIAAQLAAAGFPSVPGVNQDTPKPGNPDPAEWQKRFHANADPGRPVNLHVRVAGSAGWRYALLFRDWLRSEPTALAMYEAHKLEISEAHAGDGDTEGYAEAKEPWFTQVAWPLMAQWAARTGWQPPSYQSSADGKRGQ